MGAILVGIEELNFTQVGRPVKCRYWRRPIEACWLSTLKFGCF